MTTRNLFAALLAAVLVAAPGAATVQGAPVCGTFEVVPGPDTTGGDAALKAVAALEGKAWAIGWLRKSLVAAEPVILSWDGHAWQHESAPSSALLGSEATFEGIAAGRAGIWVVGHYRDASGVVAPLILGNEGGFWQRMTVESETAARPAALRDVFVTAGREVWAVGDAFEAATARTVPFAARYDGGTWREVALPATAGRLMAVAVAGDSVWAVGHEIVSSSSLPETTVARIELFDGKGWVGIKHPAVRPGTALNDVVALAADDVWAIGQDGTSGLFLHWNGAEWTEHPAIPDAAPVAVAGVSADDVWAVGAAAFYHFDGQAWMTIPATNKPAQSARRGIAVGGPCQVWAVGSFMDDRREFALFERLQDPAAPQVPAAPVAVVATATAHDSALVEWQHAGGATEFVVERCDAEGYACDLSSAPGYAVVAKLSASAGMQYKDSSLKPKTYFTYRVRAGNVAGESVSSASATVLTPAAPETSPTPEGVPVPPSTGPVPTTPQPAPTTSRTAGPSLPTRPFPGPRTSDPGPEPVPAPQSPESEPAPLPPTTPPSPESEPVPPAPTPMPVPEPEPTKASIPVPPTVPVPPSPLPAPEPQDTCTAKTAEVIVDRSGLMHVSAARLEIVLKDEAGAVVVEQCLPVKWMAAKDGAPVTVESRRSGTFATVSGEPGIYAIRALAPNGVSVDVVVTLD